MKPRLLVVDDHAIVRESLQSALSDHDVIEARDGHEALERAAEGGVEVAVVDIALPQLNGFDVAERLLKRHALASVLLSMHDGEDYVAEALRREVRGYVLKSAPLEELETAIRRVAAGGVYFSAALMPTVLAFARQGLPPHADDPGLTAREREVLQLVAEGKSNAEVAQILVRSPKTIRAHRENLMKKLDAHNLADLVHWAIELRLIVP